MRTFVARAGMAFHCTTVLPARRGAAGSHRPAIMALAMLATLEQSGAPALAGALRGTGHVLVVMPPATGGRVPDDVPFRDALVASLSRRRKKAGDLAKAPVAVDLPQGGLAVWVAISAAAPAFERLTLARKAAALALAEKPRTLAIAVCGSPEERRAGAEAAVYAAWVNGAPLPERKKKSEAVPLRAIRLYGHRSGDALARERAAAEGNTLCRELTVLPPNELTPGVYRDRIARLARREGWRREEYGVRRLKRMGAGAFVAVARGSAVDDAAIVRLRYRHARARRSVALVGKGICFDTGGHNLKSARHMQGMHADMNGSAVVLGILLAATRLGLAVNLDCWLAIAQNHLSPRAYKQNEVVTALDGTTIEIVHTDAEGRMVLADALALAARDKPDLIVDFATLTGSMHTALGARYSGVFATSDALGQAALAAGRASGERVCLFPLDEDYDEALESAIADVKQCTLEGAADHILAARFLQRFTGKCPWLHVDLSAATCKGGLAAAGTEVTGFGVAWGLKLLAAGYTRQGAVVRSPGPR
ncbi:MAG: leucyl aminopeptidase family protein [Burkholderiales bacterium]|nr:leucyl aminopeptidase family protein [Burkholderiales bacterium]